MVSKNKFFFSPTSYLRFLACNNSVTLRNLHQDIRVKTPQKALLGQIAHKVLERASIHFREFENQKWSDWFEIAWKDAETEFFEKYKSEWHPNPVAPLISWKSYFKTKNAARGLIGSSFASKIQESEFVHIANPNVKVYTEKLIVDESLSMLGYVDRLVLFSDRAHIYDYKFGQGALDSPEYKIQLGIYAILTSRKYGLPVKEAAVIAGTGKEFKFNFENGYLTQLEMNIQAAIKIVESGLSKASPSLGNCRFCSFKPVCKDFNASRITAENGIPLVVKGKVTAIRMISSEFTAISILDDSHIPSKSSDVAKVPVGYEVQIGDSVHISGPMHFFTQSNLEFKANTIFWRL